MNVVAKELMCPRERVFFSLILSIIIGDADPSPRRDPCVVAAMDKFTWTTESCGGKGTAWPLSQEESTPTFALTGFYCFSGHITWRMVLIYYALCFRWLQKTKERMLLIT